jgi:WD40 repeat protein
VGPRREARTRAIPVAPGEDGALAFSPDGRTLAAAAKSGLIRLLDPRTGKERATLGGDDGLVYQLAFSPDGRLLAAGYADGRIQLWDVAAARAVGDPLVGHDGQVSAVAFSPDGRTLASGGFDRRVMLWDVASHQRIGQIGAHSGLVDEVAFGRDDRRLASAAHGEIRVWDADPASWRRRACDIANRELTRNEWRQTAGDLPYRALCTRR